MSLPPTSGIVGPVPPICFGATPQLGSVALISSNPAQWSMRIVCTPQAIYEGTVLYTTETGTFQVGQWFSNDQNGYCFKVVQITQQNSSFADIVVEDEEYFNEANYPYYGSPSPLDGVLGYVFTLNQQGVPLLTQVNPSALPGPLYLHNVNTSLIECEYVA